MITDILNITTFQTGLFLQVNWRKAILTRCFYRKEIADNQSWSNDPSSCLAYMAPIFENARIVT